MDLSDDGVLEIVGAAGLADHGGVGDVGAIYVWTGPTSSAAAPNATLSVPGAVAGDRLAYRRGLELRERGGSPPRGRCLFHFMRA